MKSDHEYLSIPSDHDRIFRQKNLELLHAFGQIGRDYPPNHVRLRKKIVRPEKGYYSLDYILTAESQEAQERLDKAYQMHYQQVLLEEK